MALVATGRVMYMQGEQDQDERDWEEWREGELEWWTALWIRGTAK